MSRDKFATAITCIDGRVQQPIMDWVKLHVNVHHVDLVIDKCMVKPRRVRLSCLPR